MTILLRLGMNDVAMDTTNGPVAAHVDFDGRLGGVLSGLEAARDFLVRRRGEHSWALTIFESFPDMVIVTEEEEDQLLADDIIAAGAEFRPTWYARIEAARLVITNSGVCWEGRLRNIPSSSLWTPTIPWDTLRNLCGGAS
jgi:hypothetical protein